MKDWKKILFNKQEEGVGLLAITMIFSIAMMLLASTALFMSMNTKGMARILTEGSQAENIANTAIDRVSWIITQKCLKYNTIDYLDPNTYSYSGLRGTEASSCDLTKLNSGDKVESFMYPTTSVPMGSYKVKIIQCTPITNRYDGQPGRKLTIEAIGYVGDTARKVTKNIEVYQVNSTLFKRAIIGNNIPACMFCHDQIFGDVGCMGDKTARLSHSTHMSKIYGNLELGGDFTYTNQICSSGNIGSSGQTKKQILYYTDPNYSVITNYRSKPENAKKTLPNSIDMLGQNKSYVLSLCSGKLTVDYADQITPKGVYQLYTGGDANSALQRATYIENNASTVNGFGVKKDTDANGISKYYIENKYDLDNSSTSDPNSNYDSCVTLIGTNDHPIQIDGKVYIDGDVLIKGVVSGKGVIYSSRNIYIMDTVTYKNPPDELKAVMSDPNNTMKLGSSNNDLNSTGREKWIAASKSTDEDADQLGLAAEGNILLGNPLQKSSSDVAIRGSSNTTWLLWQGYIRGLMQDGLVYGNEGGAAQNQFANQSDENVFGHNRYGFDGGGTIADANTPGRVSRYSGNAPNGKSVSTMTTRKPGLLPSGSTLANADANGVPSRNIYDNNNSDSYNNGWLNINQWNYYNTKRTIRNSSGTVLNDSAMDPNMGRVIDPVYPSRAMVLDPNDTKTIGTPKVICGVLYAEGCIAGGNFNNKVSPLFYGSFVSNDTHYINATAWDGAWSSSNTWICHDERANAEFMGFPPTITFKTIGYTIKGSSPDEFDDY